MQGKRSGLSARDAGTRRMTDHITRWEHRYEFRSGKVTPNRLQLQGAILPAMRLRPGQADDEQQIHHGEARQHRRSTSFTTSPAFSRRRTTARTTPKSAWRRKRPDTTWWMAASTCRTFHSRWQVQDQTPPLEVGGRKDVRHHLDPTLGQRARLQDADGRACGRQLQQLLHLHPRDR